MIRLGEGNQPTAQTGMAAKLRAEQPDPPPGDQPADEAVAASAPPVAPLDPQRIGVVFVHGIGDQKPADTLLSWSRPLLRVVSTWQATTPGVPEGNDPTVSANVDFSGGTRPFVVADIPAFGDHPAQHWHLTEAWWASRVSPPSVGTMFDWLVPDEMQRLVRGITTGIASVGSPLFRLIDRVFLPVFIVPVTLLVVLVYAVFRVLQAVPVKAIRDFAAIRAVQFFLVDWFGDVRVLIADRTQAANIRGRVAEAIRDCREAGCGTIVLIGHSGGTIVGYMTLADTTYAHLPVDTFVTHGQALGIAWRLGRIDAGDTPDRRPDRIYPGDRLAQDLSTVPGRETLRWYDFWATHDPAPAGGLEHGPHLTLPSAVRGASIRVFNRMSLRNDHGGYWDNDEEFVLPVARLIDLAPGGGRETSRFFPEAPAGAREQRRQERVKLLQLAWVAVMWSAALAIPLAIIDQLIPGREGNVAQLGSAAWVALGSALVVLRPVLAFFDLAVPVIEPIDGALAVIVGMIGLIAAYLVLGGAMSRLWTRWDARERVIGLQPVPRWRSWTPLKAQLLLCALAAPGLFLLVVSGTWLTVLPSVVLVAAAYLVAARTGPGVVAREAAPPPAAVGDEGEAPAGAAATAG